jgi:hypothetical protein
MNSWEKIEPFKRIKFKGNKADKTDFKKWYSMSIEKPREYLLKTLKLIYFIDDKLQQEKDFVSKNRELLIRMSNGDKLIEIY